MDAPHQQVDVARLLYQQEGTEAFMVGALLYIVRRGVPLRGRVGLLAGEANRHP